MANLAAFIVLLTYACSAFLFLPRDVNICYSKNCPLSILGAGTFKINQTPQQSADIFRKKHICKKPIIVAFTVNQESGGHSGRTLRRYSKCSPFLLSNILQLLHYQRRKWYPHHKPQPKPLTWPWSTSTMVNRRERRTLVYPSHPRTTYARQGRRGTKKSWATSHNPSPLQAAMWTSYSLHCPLLMVSVN